MTKDDPGAVIAGYLDVKVPAHGKRRRFGPWKSWRRHWVVARSCGEDPSKPEVELVLKPARLAKEAREAWVRIPAGAQLCRTASRSRSFAFVANAPSSMEGDDTANSPSVNRHGYHQHNVYHQVYLAGRSESDTERWMDALCIMLSPPEPQDESRISAGVLDGAWSRGVGLAGSEVEVSVCVSSVCAGMPSRSVVLRDLKDNRVRAVWPCMHLSPARLAGGHENVVLLAANSSCPGGPGQIRLRCPSAVRLVRLLNDHDVDRGEDGAIRVAHSSANIALLRGRRLSRSEGDLVLSPLQDPQDPGHEERRREACSRSRTLRPRATLPTTLGPLSPLRLLHGRRRAETLRSDAVGLSASPPPPSALSVFGGKIASGLISAGLGLMLSTPGGSEVEDNEDGEDDEQSPSTDDLNRRRESGVSIASGIYEEILDEPRCSVEERLYENAVLAGRRRQSRAGETHYEDPALLFSPRDVDSLLESIDHHQGHDASSPPPLPPRHNLTPLSILTRTNVVDSKAVLPEVEDGEYVPMSRPLPSPTTCEPLYLPMSPAARN